MRGYLAHANLVFRRHYELLRQRIHGQAISTLARLAAYLAGKLYFEPVSESGEKGLSEISATVPCKCCGKYNWIWHRRPRRGDAVAYVGGLRVTCRDC